MAEKEKKGSAQPDATASVQPADEKVVYFNTTQGTHPRGHQPADPKEAERANKAASERRAPSDKVRSTVPAEQDDPKEVKKSAGEANKEASDVNAKGE